MNKDFKTNIPSFLPVISSFGEFGTSVSPRLRKSHEPSTFFYVCLNREVLYFLIAVQFSTSFQIDVSR